MFSKLKKTIHMKILRLFAIILILMNSAMLLADDTGFVVKLNVVEDKILAGDHFNVDVEITNPENFYGFDLFINLKPLGLDEAFEFVSFTPADDRFDGHTSGSPPPVNNILRIFAAHEGETTAFLGNEGAIGTIQLKAPELPGGPHLLQIDEVQSVLSDIDGLPIQYTVDPSQAEVILVGNEMTILDAEVIIGQDVTIYVEIDNYQDFTAFQADIILPDDFEYIAGTAMLSDRAVAGDHQLDVSEYIKDGNTILRLFAASADNTLFGGNGGVVVQFGLTCDIDAEDESYPLDFEASIISDVLGANILTEQNAGEITVFSNNTIIVVDAEGLTNETITMELDIDNSLPFVGFEVEIVFPEGFTFYPESLELTDRAAADHNLEVSALPGVDNAYKVFVFSPSNSEFSLFEGAVATFHVKLPNDPGTYDVEILNGIIANEQGQEIESDKVDGLVTVQTIIELALQDTDACSNFPVTVDLNLLNSQVLLGFETRVQIPDGFSYVAGSAVVNPARVEEHLVDAQFNEVTGVLTVIVFSNNPDANEIAYTNESSWIVQFDLDAPDVQESTDRKSVV